MYLDFCQMSFAVFQTVVTFEHELLVSLINSIWVVDSIWIVDDVEAKQNAEEDFLTTFLSFFSSVDACFRSCNEMSLQLGSVDLFLTSLSVVRGGISLTDDSFNRGDFIFSKIWTLEVLRFGKKPEKKLIQFYSALGLSINDLIDFEQFFKIPEISLNLRIHTSLY